MRNAILLVTLALGLAGCAAPAAPTAEPSATPLPTETPALTLTPIELPSKTATIAAPAATPTTDVSSAGGLTCRVISQSMKNGVKVSPKERFDVGWKVANNSGVEWEPGSIYFAYYSGTRMFESGRTDLQTTVGRADTVALVADMVAPKHSGKYTTVWALRRGEEDFCHVTLTITVP